MFVKMMHDISRRIDAKINSTISTVLNAFVCGMFVGNFSSGIGILNNCFIIADRNGILVTLMTAPVFCVF